MQPDDDASFARLIVATAELYGKRCSPELITLYREALNRYEFAAIKAALSAHALDPDVGQFMPKPADIVRHIDGGKDDRALKAWSRLEKAIRHHGAYESIVFDDPLIHVVANDMGGWIKLCATPGDEMPFRAAEFVKRYRGCVNRPTPETAPRLVGRFEADGAPTYPIYLGADRRRAEEHINRLYGLVDAYFSGSVFTFTKQALEKTA